MDEKTYCFTAGQIAALSLTVYWEGVEAMRKQAIDIVSTHRDFSHNEADLAAESMLKAIEAVLTPPQAHAEIMSMSVQVKGEEDAPELTGEVQ